MDKAGTITDPRERAKAWADVDKDDHVDRRPAIPWIWDNERRTSRSKNVKGVLDKWNDDWNLSYSRSSRARPNRSATGAPPHPAAGPRRAGTQPPWAATSSAASSG